MLVGVLMVGAGAAAGAFGALLGLGGGILIVPLLTLGFGLPLREAVGVSLVSVIMTSSAAAGVYLGRHVANLRLGMSLELFTAFGALVGGSIAFLLDERILSLLFSLLLVYVAFTMARVAAGGAARARAAGRGARGGSGRVADRRARGRERRQAAPSRTRPPRSSIVGDLSGEGYQVRNLALRASSARRSRASCRRCSASVAGSSRCR